MNNNFRITESEFYMDRKKTLFLCGEIHYFRIKKSNWEKVLDTLSESGCNAVAYYVPWHIHEYEEGKFDFCGEMQENLNLAEWISLTQKKGLKGFIRIGPYIYSESTDLGVPKWFSANHQDALVKGYRNGCYETTGEVNFASHNHPEFLDAVRRWYGEVCKVIRKNIYPEGNIVMLQLCNEIPGEDVDDRNPVTLGIGKENGLFPEYLKEKYKTVQVLSKAYGRNFKSLLMTEPHQLEEADIKMWQNDHLEFYYNYYYPAYFRTLKDIVESLGISTYFTHNAYNPRALSLHYGNKKKNPWLTLSVDCYYSLMGQLNMKSATYFNDFGAEYMKNFLKCTPWVAEHESGYWFDEPKVYASELYLWNIWAVAAGYRGINMYLFAGGRNTEKQGFYGTDHNWQAPIEHNGEKNDRYYAIQRSFADIEKDKEVLTEELQYDIALGIKNSPGLIWKRVAKDGDETFYQLKKAGFTPKVIDFMGMPDSMIKKEKCIWIVSDEEMEAEDQDKLLNYVYEGGKLIVGGRIPFYGVWERRLGIQIKDCENRIQDQQKICLNKEEYDVGYTIQEVIMTDTFTEDVSGTVIAYNREGKAAVSMLRFGQGMLLLMPFPQQTRFDQNAVMVQQLLEIIDIFPAIKAKDLRILPKAGGKSVVLNPHPVEIRETVCIRNKEHTVMLDSYSYCIIEEI